LTKHLYKKGNTEQGGLYYLKGGDFENEIKQINKFSKQFELNTYFEEEFFETKKIVHIRY
jgi:16S rRNA (guanine527-N7)-methyltransferase